MELIQLQEKLKLMLYDTVITIEVSETPFLFQFNLNHWHSGNSYKEIYKSEIDNMIADYVNKGYAHPEMETVRDLIVILTGGTF